MYKFLSIVLAIGLMVGGCKHTDNNNGNPSDVVSKASNTYAVVIGMEKSNFAGACSGSRLDSNRMYNLISKYAINTVLLQDEAATKANVKSAIEKGIAQSKNGLFILYYSGHGGSDPFYDTGKDEGDGKDEYLCLYDTYLRDNEIWQMIRKSEGRVLLLVDACHSQTMYRAPGFKLRIPLKWDHTLNEQQQFSMLCWSGCPDSDLSYGSSSGGVFTNTLLKYFDTTISYQALWDKIKVDKILRMSENPQSTVLGSGFEGKAFLR